jgi:polar amino acid transport system substrate-binding protein
MAKFVFACQVLVLSLMLTTMANDKQKAYAQESLVFSKPGPLDYHAQISENILKEAYARIGIKVTTMEFPGERALRESNSGRVDGEVNRIRGIAKKYQSLRIIPVAINALKGSVFTKNSKIKPTSWKDLRAFRIGLRKGAKYAEYGTTGMKVIAAATNKMVFRMLDRNRIDVAISTALEGSNTIRILGLKGISMVEQPLVTLELFHFLHVKHETLIARITISLEAMAREGRIQNIRNKASEERHSN